MGNVLKLPRTERGREDLLYFIKAVGGWDDGHGTNVADIDWDESAASWDAEVAEREAEETRINAWRRDRGLDV